MTVTKNDEQGDPKTIKCVVWDLDDTLWEGVLLEDGDVRLREETIRTIRALDGRGILHSVASKNSADEASEKLRDLGIDEYFLYPQIDWSAKSVAIARIARTLNLATDALAFVDDDPFEREEVAFAHPEVLCLDAREAGFLPERPEFQPRFVTDDARMRRLLYLNDRERKRSEERFEGTSEDFLKTLGLRCRIGPATKTDLQRAEELTLRTNQLNTTGYTYSYDDLDELRCSDGHLLLVASLEDRFGSYGTIGLALVEKQPSHWTLKLLLMSCRVMSRGVGRVLLRHVMERAREAGVRLRGEFRSNGRNRMMYVTYRFAGFREVVREGDRYLLEHDLATVPAPAEYVDVELTA